jgi:hypothetical protein
MADAELLPSCRAGGEAQFGGEGEVCKRVLHESFNILFEKRSMCKGRLHAELIRKGRAHLRHDNG